MTDKEAAANLRNLKNYAQAKIDTGSEPPWAWYQYLKLIEVSTALLEGMRGIELVDKRTKKVNLPI